MLGRHRDPKDAHADTPVVFRRTIARHIKLISSDNIWRNDTMLSAVDTGERLASRGY